MLKSIFNTYPFQYLLNKARSIYYPVLFNTFEANEVIHGVWLGSLESACDFSEISRKNITHIVTAVWDINPTFPESDLKYFNVPLIDRKDQQIKNYFDVVVNFMDEAIRNNGGVLVHCICGVSRSPTLVCAYLMKKHNIDVSSAIKMVKRARPQAQPNIGFLMQLLNENKED